MSAEARGAGPDAAVFDLDGVLTFTARVHAAAWKELFDAYLRTRAERYGEPFRPFDAVADYRDYIDGRLRYDGVRTFLASRGIALPPGDPTDPEGRETIRGLGDRKNVLFRQRLERTGVDVDEHAVRFVRELRAGGVRVGVASSSKNAALILERAGLAQLFDARVDGVVSEALGLSGKPRPDGLLKCLELLGAPDASRALVAEDAIAGVAAGWAGRFGLVLGVDRGNDWLALREHGADWVIRDFQDISRRKVVRYFASRRHARPNAIAQWTALEAELVGKRIAVFLDAEVLRSIPGRPEGAPLPEELRGALRDVAAAWRTTIVGERPGEDLAVPVGIARLGDVAQALADACRLGTITPDIVPLYIGGATAEDGLRALRGCGIGILVTESPVPTTARYTLQNTVEVEALLRRLAARPFRPAGAPHGPAPGR